MSSNNSSTNLHWKPAETSEYARHRIQYVAKMFLLPARTNRHLSFISFRKRGAQRTAFSIKRHTKHASKDDFNPEMGTGKVIPYKPETTIEKREGRGGHVKRRPAPTAIIAHVESTPIWGRWTNVASSQTSGTSYLMTPARRAIV